MYRTTKVVQSGGSTVLLAKPQLGFNPADTQSQFQVSCKGLLGGKFAVKFVPAGSTHLITFVENLLESELCLSAGDSFLFDTMIIEFSALGVGADPEVVVTLWTKGL